MAPFISIIMPVYKSEKYIVKSIETVLAQTFTDFELLLVDDCSPDNSGKICDEFAKKDSRIKVIHLPENGGVSNARNTAMTMVSGVYLCFLDADDYFDDNMLEILAESVKKNPGQVVIFGLVEEYYDEKGQIVNTRKVVYEDKIIKDQQALRNEIPSLDLLDLYGYPCNKMYNIQYLRETKATFPKMKFNEDIIFNIDFFMDADSCNILNFAPYHYVKHAGSTTGSFIPTYYEDIMVKIDRMYSQFEYWNMLDKKILEFLALRYTRYLFSALERNCDKKSAMTHKQRKDFIEKVFGSDRYKKLSLHLCGGGFIGIMARVLKTKSSLLCLLFARVIYLVKRFVPGLFRRLS